MSTRLEVRTQAKKTTNSWIFWVLAGSSIIFYNSPLIGFLLTPVNTFATMIHEMSHAIMCLVTGGAVSGMTIVSDSNGHGGLTFCHGGNPFIYTPAGYLGTAVFGSILIYLGQFPKISKSILIAMGVAIGAASLLLVGANLFNTGLQGLLSFLWASTLSVLLLLAGFKLRPSTANILLLFLAVQTGLNSFTSLVLLAQVSLGLIPFASFSDATSMEQLTGLPAGLWSVAWALMSAGLLGLSLWWSYGRRLFAKAD